MKKISLFLLFVFTFAHCAPSWQHVAKEQLHVQGPEYQFFSPAETKDLLGFMVLRPSDPEQVSVQDLSPCAIPLVKRQVQEVSSYQGRELNVENPRVEKALPGPPSNSCYFQDGEEYQVVTEQLIAKRFSHRENWYSKKMTSPEEERTLAIRLQKAKAHLKETQCEVKEGQTCSLTNLSGNIQVSKVDEKEVWFDLTSSGSEPRERFVKQPAVPKLCMVGTNRLSFREGCYFYPNDSTTVAISLVKENNQPVFLISFRSLHVLQ